MACYFISYNSADRGWAEWMAWQLEDSGHTVIIQAWDFVPGSNLALKMDEATANADKIIAVLSPQYLQSIYTQPEWAAAFAGDPTGKESKLIPVRVEECNLTGLLKQIVYIDLVGLDEENAKREFLGKIDAGRMRPKVAPAFPGVVSGELPPTDGRQQDRKTERTLPQPMLKDGASCIQRVTPITDLERAKFINDSFGLLAIFVEQYIMRLKEHSPGLEYNLEKIHSRKFLVSLYFNGSLKYKLKVWLSNDYGTVDTIKLSYGRNVSDSDTSYNEQIIVEDEKGELGLKTLMNFSGNKFQTLEEIVAALLGDLVQYFR